MPPGIAEPSPEALVRCAMTTLTAAIAAAAAATLIVSTLNTKPSIANCAAPAWSAVQEARSARSFQRLSITFLLPGSRSASDSYERLDLRVLARPVHDLAAVRVVADPGVALGRQDRAVLAVEADVIGHAAVPIEADDVARLRVARDLQAVHAAPRVVDDVRDIGVVELRPGDVVAPRHEDRAPGLTIDAVPLAEARLVRPGRPLFVTQVPLGLAQRFDAHRRLFRVGRALGRALRHRLGRLHLAEQER